MNGIIFRVPSLFIVAIGLLAFVPSSSENSVRREGKNGDLF